MSWQRAIILWFQEKVDVLEYHDVKVSSTSQSFSLPSVLILRKYIRPRFNNGVRASRQNIFLRDEYRCQYCYKPFAKKLLTVDHVHPISRGGQNTWENMVAACSKCNNKKANRTPREAGMKLYKKPVQPNWPLSDENLSPRRFMPEQWRDYLVGLDWLKSC